MISLSTQSGRLQRKLFNNLKLGRKVYTMAEENNVSNWLQDNLRIIISVGIVILLVFAIYSYSKRNSRTDVIVDDSGIEEVAMTTTSNKNDSSEINEIIDEIKNDDQTTPNDAEEVMITENTTEEAAAEKKTTTDRIAQEKADQEKRIADEKAVIESQALADIQNQEQKDDTTAVDVVREVIASRSKQKDGVTVVVAVRGDSMTTLARKAAATYIQKNNVTELTNAHKIYIEDYLRKSQQQKKIYPGTEMEISNAMIDQAIVKSQTLTDAQLKNLDRYAQNVSSLQ